MPWWKAARCTITGTFASRCSLSVCPCRVNILDPAVEERRNITNSPRALKEYSVPSNVMTLRLPYTSASGETWSIEILKELNGQTIICFDFMNCVWFFLQYCNVLLYWFVFTAVPHLHPAWPPWQGCSHHGWPSCNLGNGLLVSFRGKDGTEETQCNTTEMAGGLHLEGDIC